MGQRRDQDPATRQHLDRQGHNRQSRWHGVWSSAPAGGGRPGPPREDTVPTPSWPYSSAGSLEVVAQAAARPHAGWG